jgi:hypothetical protein
LGIEEEARMRQVSKTFFDKYGGSEASEKGKKQKLMDLIKEFKKNRKILSDYHKLMYQGKNLDTASYKDRYIVIDKINNLEPEIRRLVRNHFTIDEVFSLPSEDIKFLEEEIGIIDKYKYDDNDKYKYFIN